MDEHIELVSDGDGLAVFGRKSAVERFLRDKSLLKQSEVFSLDKLGDLAQLASPLIEGASEVASGSGRWVRLTEESAGLVREFGLMKTSTQGVSHAMIGDPGSISKWIQIENGTGALLNPTVLAGAAGVMAQVARQSEMREIKAYLKQIDKKVSAVLRAQKDSHLATLAGCRFGVDRAMSVRDKQDGVTDPTTWSTVQNRIGEVDDLLGWAILGLNRIAGRFEDAERPGERAKLARTVENEVAEFLAVIAHCFDLHDALEIMRLDRVLAESPDQLNAQRGALEIDRRDRRDNVQVVTGHLIRRIDEAASAANSHVVLHPRAANSVSSSANAIGAAVVELQQPLGIRADRSPVTTPTWLRAMRDVDQVKNAAKEAGPKAAVPAVIAVGAALFVIPQTRPYAVKAFKLAKKLANSSGQS